MLVRRLVVLGVVAVGMTILGVMTMGLAETLKFGIIGLAAAGGLLLLMRVLGGQPAAAKPPAQGKQGASRPTGKQAPPKGGSKG